MSQVIITALVWLSLFVQVFLLIGVIINIFDSKGFKNMLEIVVCIGVLFTVFILGVIAFNGQFVFN